MSKLSLLNGVQLVKIPVNAAARQAGRESCTSRRATGAVKRRQQESGPRIQLRNRNTWWGPTPSPQWTAASRVALGEGLTTPPESRARGTLSEGLPTNVGDLFISIIGVVPRPQGRPEGTGTGEEGS